MIKIPNSLKKIAAAILVSLFLAVGVQAVNIYIYGEKGAKVVEDQEPILGDGFETLIEAPSIESLVDTDISLGGADIDDILQYNGVAWENVPLADIGGGGGSSVWSTSTDGVLYYNGSRDFVVGGTAATTDDNFQVIGGLYGDEVTTPSLTINGETFTDLTGTGLSNVGGVLTSSGSMTYPDAGIALSTGSAWDTSITNNSANWNTAYGWGDWSGEGFITGLTWSGITGTQSDISLSGFTDDLSYLTSSDINTYSKLNTIVADQTLAYSGGAFHDGFSDFVANEHIDWTGASAGTIHTTNYVDNNTTYTSSDFTHNSLSGVSVNEHIDWTTDQGATNINAGNYTDTNTQLSQEQVEDYVGGMTSGTETHIAVTYDDTSGNLNYVVADDWYNSLADLQSSVTNDFHNLGGTDANTTYTAGGTLLDLTGTVFSVDEGTLTDGKICTYKAGTGIECNTDAGSGSGDVTGPASATDNAIARFDTATGKLLQNSTVTINDSGLLVASLVVGTTGFGMNSGGSINNRVNSQDMVIFEDTSSAVNEITIKNNATGNAPEVQATGNDTNVDLKLISKGTGQIDFNGNYKFPLADGTVNQVLGTDGSGALTWVTPAGATYTAGDGLTLTGADFDCDTANGSTFGCLTSSDWNTFNNKVTFPGFTSLLADYSFTDNSTNWNTAYGWGNHASTGYLVDPMTTRGDIIIRDASNDTKRLAIGTAGQVLFTDGTDVAWQTIPNASAIANGILTMGDWTTFNSKLDSADINTYSKLNTIVADQTLVYAGGAFHNGFSDYVANEHIDWTTDQGAKNIHSGNYTDTNTTYAGGTNLTLSGTTFNVDDAFIKNTGDIGTGVYNFGGATSFEIVNGTAPTVDTTGEIALDTTDNQLLVADSDGIARVVPLELSLFGGTIASTSEAFVSGGKLGIAKMIKNGRTLSEFRCWVVGGTSVVVNVSDGTNDTETITCGTSVTSDTSVTTNNSFAANEKWELQFGTITGNVDYLMFEAYGYITRE